MKKENDDETVSFCLREIEDKKGQERPRGRSGHKLLPIKRNKLLLIGGESEFEGEEKGFRTLNDIWLFDIFSETWIRL